MTIQRIVVAVMAAATSALSIGLLPSPWDGIAVVVVAGLGTLYETPKPAGPEPLWTDTSTWEWKDPT